MPIIDLMPPDRTGIDLSRPAQEVRWRKLTNVMFRDGSLVNRPGFREFADTTVMEFPSLTVEIAPVIGIMEIYNPGSSITGRESWAYETAIIRPDGSSDIVAGWTGSHTDIDETPASGGTDVLTTSTEGAQKAITFANPSGTFDVVTGIIIKGLARNTLRGGVSTIKHYIRSGSTNYAIPNGEIDIYAYSSAETDDWDAYSIPVAINPVDGGRFVTADLNALSIVVELLSSSRSVSEIAVPSGNGNYTAFTDATAGGSASYVDYDLTPFEDYANNGAKSSTADQRQSWTLPATLNNTYNSVSSISLQAWVGLGLGEHQIEWFFRTGSTDYEIETVDVSPTGPLVVDSHGLASGQLFLTSTTNPATSAAWTQAQLQSGEFGIRNVDGGTIMLKSVGMIVEGLTTGQAVEIDTLSVECMGLNITAGSGNPYDRIVSTNFSHLRADVDAGVFIFTDVTNSVPMDDSPSFVPLDHALLYGQIYVVNGIDNTRYYPNGSSVFAALTTNGSGGAPLTGRTVASFADRLLYGWVNDNGTITPERVAYSNQFSGSAHNGASAGDFDIIDTPGGIVKLLALNESIAFCGKEIGIYALRRTGNSSFPIIVDPIDYETRCIAMSAVKRVVTAAGQPLILFLGWNPSVGYNVFAFDGSSVRPVGDPISPALRDDANHELLRWAFAEIEPDTGTYCLFFPEGTDLRVDSGYAMSIRYEAWTRIELPWPVFSAGVWTVVSQTLTPTGVNAVDGKLTMVLGGQNNLPYITHQYNYDSLLSPEDSPDNPDFHGTQAQVDSADGEAQGRVKQFYTAELETGDIHLASTASDVQMVPYRLHVQYTNRGPFRVLVKASEDGGINYSTAQEYIIGALPASEEKYHSVLDLGPHNARMVRFNLTIVPEDTINDLSSRWQIDKMYLQYEIGGVDGP